MTKEELLELGLSEEQITGVFKLNGLAIEGLKSTNSVLEKENEQLKGQITEANEKIENFKGLDIETIKKEAEEYKTKFEKANSENEETLNQIKLEFDIEKAVLKSGARNEKAVKSLLDVEELKTSKNFKDDLEKQIKNLQEKESYLFKSENPRMKVVGKSNGTLEGGITKEQFDAMSYAERVELKKNDGNLYNELIK